MTYYRVNKLGADKNLRNGITLIPDELFTEKERIKNGIPVKFLDLVEISRMHTFFLFGCRFEIGA